MLSKYFGIKKSICMELILILLWTINLGLIIAHYLGDGGFPIGLLVFSGIVTVIVNKRIKSHYYD